MMLSREVMDARVAEWERLADGEQLTGRKYGRLTVVRYLGNGGGQGTGPKVWLCRCECGRHDRFDTSGAIGYDVLFGIHYLPECRHCSDVRRVYRVGKIRPAEMTEEECMGWLLPKDIVFHDTSVPADWGDRKRSKTKKKKKKAA